MLTYSHGLLGSGDMEGGSLSTSGFRLTGNGTFHFTTSSAASNLPQSHMGSASWYEGQSPSYRYSGVPHAPAPVYDVER